MLPRLCLQARHEDEGSAKKTAKAKRFNETVQARTGKESQGAGASKHERTSKQASKQDGPVVGWWEAGAEE